MFKKSNQFIQSLLITCLLCSSAYAQQQPPVDSPTLGIFGIGVKKYSLEVDQITDAYAETTGVQAVVLSWSLPDMWGRFVPAVTYEFSPGASTAQEELVERAQAADNGWERLLADIGYKFSNGISVSLAMEKQLYRYSVQTTRDYFYVSGSGTELLVPGDTLNTFNEFNDLSLTSRGDIEFSRDFKFIWEVGYFDLDYRKPFTTDIFTGISTIYDTQFSASGLQLGGGISYGNANLFLKIRGAGTSAEALLPNGFRVSGVSGSSGFTANVGTELDYQQFILTFQYNLDKWLNSVNLGIEVNYDQRTFSGYVDNINDDKLLNIQLHAGFSI